MSTASNWANTLLGARRSRQDSWQEEVVADRSYRVRKGRAPEQRVAVRACVCALVFGPASVFVRARVVGCPFVAAAGCPPS